MDWDGLCPCPAATHAGAHSRYDLGPLLQQTLCCGSCMAPFRQENPSMRIVNLPWGDQVSPEFAAKEIEICDRLGIDPGHLMACMKFESDLKPTTVNRVSGATGLIQFMPDTAHNLGTSCAELLGMYSLVQLDYVEAYFRGKGKLSTLEDVYMAILWPAAIGKPNDYILCSDSDPGQKGKAYLQNKGLDLNKDGHITKWEATTPVRALYTKGFDHSST